MPPTSSQIRCNQCGATFATQNEFERHRHAPGSGAIRKPHRPPGVSVTLLERRTTPEPSETLTRLPLAITHSDLFDDFARMVSSSVVANGNDPHSIFPTFEARFQLGKYGVLTTDKRKEKTSTKIFQLFLSESGRIEVKKRNNGYSIEITSNES